MSVFTATWYIAWADAKVREVSRFMLESFIVVGRVHCGIVVSYIPAFGSLDG